MQSGDAHQQQQNCYISNTRLFQNWMFEVKRRKDSLFQIFYFLQHADTFVVRVTEGYDRSINTITFRRFGAVINDLSPSVGLKGRRLSTRRRANVAIYFGKTACKTQDTQAKMHSTRSHTNLNIKTLSTRLRW